MRTKLGEIEYENKIWQSSSDAEPAANVHLASNGAGGGRPRNEQDLNIQISHNEAKMLNHAQRERGGRRHITSRRRARLGAARFIQPLTN